MTLTRDTDGLNLLGDGLHNLLSLDEPVLPAAAKIITDDAGDRILGWIWLICHGHPTLRRRVG